MAETYSFMSYLNRSWANPLGPIRGPSNLNETKHCKKLNRFIGVYEHGAIRKYKASCRAVDGNYKMLRRYSREFLGSHVMLFTFYPFFAFGAHTRPSMAFPLGKVSLLGMQIGKLSRNTCRVPQQLYIKCTQ